MFEIDVIRFLNDFKNTYDEYEKQKIKKSISELISQNEKEYEEFKTKDLDPQTLSLLQECENIVKEKKLEQEKEEATDSQIVKDAFMKWSQEYNLNSKQPNENCIAIINKLIEFYIENRYEVIQTILDINNEDSDYKAFKAMLKNSIRGYYARKISSYIESDKFESLSLFQKFKKDRDLHRLLKKIGRYEFDRKEINEVLT